MNFNPNDKDMADFAGFLHDWLMGGRVDHDANDEGIPTPLELDLEADRRALIAQLGMCGMLEDIPPSAHDAVAALLVAAFEFAELEAQAARDEAIKRCPMVLGAFSSPGYIRLSAN